MKTWCPVPEWRSCRRVGSAKELRLQFGPERQVLCGGSWTFTRSSLGHTMQTPVNRRRTQPQLRVPELTALLLNPKLLLLPCPSVCVLVFEDKTSN